MGVWDWKHIGDDKADERGDWERVFVGLRDGAFLGAEEGVRMRGLASLNQGWLARGGLLRLYDDRLTFAPNPMERLLLARHRTFAFGQIERLERRPARAGELSPTAQSPRIRVHLIGARSLDLIPAAGPDPWLTAIEGRRQIWERRQRFEEDEEPPEAG